MDEQIEYFECQKCGAIIQKDQAKYNEKNIVYPSYCYEGQGGCGRESKFLRLKKEYVDGWKAKKTRR